MLSIAVKYNTLLAFVHVPAWNVITSLEEAYVTSCQSTSSFCLSIHLVSSSSSSTYRILLRLKYTFSLKCWLQFLCRLSLAGRGAAFAFLTMDIQAGKLHRKIVCSLFQTKGGRSHSLFPQCVLLVSSRCCHKANFQAFVRRVQILLLCSFWKRFSNCKEIEDKEFSGRTNLETSLIQSVELAKKSRVKEKEPASVLFSSSITKTAWVCTLVAPYIPIVFLFLAFRLSKRRQ